MRFITLTHQFSFLEIICRPNGANKSINTIKRTRQLIKVSTDGFVWRIKLNKNL